MSEKITAHSLSPEDKCITAALTLAAELGWNYATLADIATEAGISLSEMRALFDDKTDILIKYGRKIDRLMLEEAGEPDPSLPVKDRLFELLMARFDLINEDKKAIQSIISSFSLDPKQALFSWPYLCRSMSWTLEACGEDTNGMKGAMKVAGLSGIFLATLKTWLNDDSEDMAQTMAALDKNLSRAQGLAERFAF